MDGILVSCVSREFHGHSRAGASWDRSYRAGLARTLERCGQRAIHQEALAQGSDLLAKLDEYIATECKAVVHLIGHDAGWCFEDDLPPHAVPDSDAVHALLRKYGDKFLASRPFLRQALLARKFRFVSATQWEAYLALHHGKPLLLFTFSDEAVRHPDFVPPEATDANRLSQRTHFDLLKASGIDRAESIGGRDGFENSVLVALIEKDIISARHSRPWWRRNLAYMALALILVVFAAVHFSGLAPEAGEDDTIRHYEDSTRMLPDIREHLGAAQHDAYFFGTSFHLSLPQFKLDIKRRLADGFRLRVLIFNPFGDRLPEAAADAGQDPQTLRDECLVTICHLRDIRRELQAEGKRHDLQVRVFSETPRLRLYVFDNGHESGRAFVVPYLDGHSATNLRGFMLPTSRTEEVGKYIDLAERRWSKAMEFDAFLKAHEDRISTR